MWNILYINPYSKDSINTSEDGVLNKWLHISYSTATKLSTKPVMQFLIKPLPLYFMFVL